MANVFYCLHDKRALEAWKWISKFYNICVAYIFKKYDGG